LAEKKTQKQLDREAVLRMEEAARSVVDFEAVLVEWNRFDDNRERVERYHEVLRPEGVLITNFTSKNTSLFHDFDDKVKMHYNEGIVFPFPYYHLAWREAINGDFLSMIYCNPEDMWQLIEDWLVALPVKKLTTKQADVLYLSAVQLFSPQDIAVYPVKTNRAVRKLLAATLESIRSKIAPRIREQLESGYPQMTLEKRQFLEWYEKSKGVQQ